MQELVPLHLLRPHPSNPRKHVDPEYITELAESLREHGQWDAILARVLPDGTHQIVAGHCRVEAACSIGWMEIRAEIREMTDEEADFAALDTNLKRRNLSELEEAEAIHGMMTVHGWTQAKVAERFGKTQAWVSFRVSLLGLAPEVKEKVITQVINPTQAREIAKAPVDVQPAIAQKAQQANLPKDEIQRMVGVLKNPEAPADVKTALLKEGRMTPAHAEQLARVKSTISRQGLIMDVSRGRLTPEQTQREVEARIEAEEAPRTLSSLRTKRLVNVHGHLVKVLALLDEIDLSDVYGLDGPALTTVEATLGNIGARLNKLGQTVTTAQSKPAAQRHQGTGKVYKFPGGAH